VRVGIHVVFVVCSLPMVLAWVFVVVFMLLRGFVGSLCMPQVLADSSVMEVVFWVL